MSHPLSACSLRRLRSADLFMTDLDDPILMESFQRALM